MNHANPPSSSGWSSELKDILAQTRVDTIAFAIPLFILVGMAVGNWPDGSDSLRSTITGLWFGLLAIGLWVFRRWNKNCVGSLLILGSVFGIFLIAGWIGRPGALLLFIIPTAFAVLMFGLLGGLACAAVLTISLLVYPLSETGFPAWRTSLIAGLWAVVYIFWLAQRPASSIGMLAWNSYAHSRALLEQSRDYQLQLNQTLEDLKFANQQLERLNRLANGLRQSEEEARRAKEQFVANVSHELRTPLNMIIGFTENIVNAPESYGMALPGALLADLTVVLRNSQHLSELVDDVLDLSQIEAGKMALSKEVVEIDQIVNEAVVAIRPLYESKGLYLRIDLAAPVPPLLADPTRIREVLLNLLSNAGRFTATGGVTVQVNCQGREIFVSVTDTGPGIKSEDINRIFKPFEQLDGSIRRNFGGTGLGLAISRSFVEMHGGRMSVESVEGKGTTFSFSLPLKEEEASPSGALQWIDPNWTERQRTRRLAVPFMKVNPRLVISEQGTAFARLLRRYLVDYEIVETPDLESAVFSARKTPSGAILVNAPTVEEAILQIGQAGGTQTAPAPWIACTVPNTDHVSSLPGVSDYLVKPVSRQQLLESLKKLNLAGKTILIVDDDPDSLRLYRRILTTSESCYRVLTAREGQEALDILRTHHPDCLITDLLMPEMDGFQLLSAKQREPALAAIPVVVITAQDSSRQPILSRSLAVISNNGLSLSQVLACLESLSQILSPHDSPAHLKTKADGHA